MTISWSLSPHVDLRSERIPEEDAQRQLATAREICVRLNQQPGLILADDVGMGKTFVALAVAASIVQQDTGSKVVVMVPSAVGDKWPKDWTVFREKCLRGGPEVRATDHAVTRGSEFLKLLDDHPERCKHIVFLTHRALTANLDDPFIKLALVRQAFRHQRNLVDQRLAFPRWASKVLNRRDFTEERVAALMKVDPSHWREVWSKVAGETVEDDLVPGPVLAALEHTTFEGVRTALTGIPLNHSKHIDRRLRDVRKSLGTALNAIWKDALRSVRAHLPLLILDEAHHLKNPNQLRGLFDTGDGGGADEVRGALGDVFDRMLLLTATPFQLGHRELISVLGLFASAQADNAMAQRFEGQIKDLASRLDVAQAASLRLERAWARLTAHDVADLPDRWWHEPIQALPEHVATIASCSNAAIASMREAAEALRPWVIRHTKVRRREHLPGASTLPSVAASERSGLPIPDTCVLPFLLAARAQAFVSVRGLQENKKMRALFADGLASSFEAYLSTRADSQQALDDAETMSSGEDLAAVDWYLERISAALPREETGARAAHPKVHATVARVIHHWREGEKVLIFCFYRATGRALRQHLSIAVAREIAAIARERFNIRAATTEEVFEQLAERADSLLRRDRPGGQRLMEQAASIAAGAGLSEADQVEFAEITLRFMRTPAFLCRYVDLNERAGEQAVLRTFEAKDGSGVGLGNKLALFAARVAMQTQEERTSLWENLRRFRTGGRQVDALDSDDSPELTPEGVLLLPNVHLANGETDQEQRRRLMATFNTPFLPEVLVASSVMAEGVDLHRECRHVIHHDLDWNPSVLEQRTGRVDRLGSKALASGRPVIVCEPYMAGTQDERQYSVVKDRERWFGVLMGGRVPDDEWMKDSIAARVTVPDKLVADLTLDLSVRPLNSP